MSPCPHMWPSPGFSAGPTSLLSYQIARILHCSLCSTGLLKLWVATHRWITEPSHVDRENAICKKTVMVMTSVSLSTNKTGALYDYFTGAL